MNDIYKTFGIYRITNLINGKTYIGKTGANFGDRWDCHRAQLRGGYHDNPHLQRAWNKYGENNFEFCIVECVTDVSALDDLEKKYIIQYRERNLCYNILDGGDGGFRLGSHLSEDAKRRIAEKNRVNMTGRKASDRTKAKMSNSQLERYSKWTEEDRIRHGKMVSAYASGYTWSNDSKARFSKLQSEHPNGAKYDINTVHNIRRLHEIENKSYREISELLNIPRHTVYLIATYRRWSNV